MKSVFDLTTRVTRLPCWKLAHVHKVTLESSSSLNAPSNDQHGDILRLLMETNNSGKRDLVLSKIMKSFSSHFWLKCSSCANNLMK